MSPTPGLSNTALTSHAIGEPSGAEAAHGLPAGMSIDAAINLMFALLCDPCVPHEQLKNLPESPPRLRELCALLLNVREGVAALAQGELQCPCKGYGFTIGSIKTLGSNLRTLTWHMRNLAQGEYTETDPYMGEFSVAFNSVVHELGSKAQGLNALVEEYKSQSRMDMLTGLPNRRAFFEVAGREVLFSRRAHTSLGLIMVDIDFFKRINDVYGHPTGDHVLQTVAHRLQGVLRVEDFCCRFGGEEFLILLREAQLQDANDVAERLRKSCCTMPIQLHAQEEHVTVSCGVTLISDPMLQAASLTQHILDDAIARADKALYRAKGQGRNCVCPEI